MEDVCQIREPYAEIALHYDHMFAVWGKDYQAEARTIQQLIHTTSPVCGNTLLDVGCGTGEHIRHLQKDYLVTGVDSSAAMLAIARSKLPDVPFHQADMRSFRLGRTFDIVLSLFSAIGYIVSIDDLLEALSCICSHLRTGGILILEPWYTPDSFELHDGDHFGAEVGFKACRLSASSMSGRVVTIESHLLVKDESRTQHFVSTHQFGLFTQSEITEVLKQCGMYVQYLPNGFSDRGLYICIKGVEGAIPA